MKLNKVITLVLSASNRTIVELKLERRDQLAGLDVSSNRTIVELKFR